MHAHMLPFVDLTCGPNFHGHASDTCSLHLQHIFKISVPVGQYNIFLSSKDKISMCWVTGTLQRHQQCAAAGVTTAAAS